MKRVYKYTLVEDIEQLRTNAIDKIITIPAAAKLLSVGMQKNSIVCWAMVEPSAEQRERCFQVAATGCDLPSHIYGNGREFIGSVQHTCMFENGFDVELVFHVFDRGEL